MTSDPFWLVDGAQGLADYMEGKVSEIFPEPTLLTPDWIRDHHTVPTGYKRKKTEPVPQTETILGDMTSAKGEQIALAIMTLDGFDLSEWDVVDISATKDGWLTLERKQ